MSFKLYHFASLQYCNYSSTRFIVYLYSTGVGRFSILWGGEGGEWGGGWEILVLTGLLGGGHFKPFSKLIGDGAGAD